MRTTYLKNTFLIASGIMIATSFGILAANPQPTSIQASLVNLVQYLGELHITSDGTPNGDDVLSINSNGNFVQTRSQDDIQYGLVNDGSVFGMPYVGAMTSSGDYSYFAGIEKLPGHGLLSVVGAMNLASGWVNYVGASDQGISLSHVSQIGVSDADNSIFVNESGVQFSFIGASNKYRFPTTAGQANQVLTTDGVGQLSWEDAGVSSTNGVLFTGIFVSSNQLQNMSVNPVELLPEPGANKFIDVIDVMFKYNYGTTPYNAETLAAYFGGSPSDALFVSQYTATLDQQQSFFIRAQHASSFQNFAPDESFKLSTQSGFSPGPGDGTLEVYITYKIIDLITP